MTRDRKLLLAWAAGIIDGEGHIGIRRPWPEKQTLRLYLDVSNTHIATIQRLVAIFGGLWRVSQRKGNRQPIAVWTVSHRKAERILRDVLPYLFTKREQAVGALEYRKLVRHRGGKQIPSDTWLLMMNLANSVNALNARKHRKVTPSQAPDAVNEANDGEGVTVMYETRKGRDDLTSPVTVS